MDGVLTVMEIQIHDKYMPNGILESGYRTKEGESDSGEIFDTVAGIGFDGVTGYGTGKVYNKYVKNKRVYSR